MIVSRIVREFLMPLVYSMFFTAAMTALLWIMTNYGALNFSTLIVGALAAIYSGLTLFGLINLVKRNKLFAGNEQDILSVRAQKIVQLSGIIAVIPALVFCAAFTLVVKSFDGKSDSFYRVKAMEGFERAIFGSSKIWAYICPAPPMVALAKEKSVVVEAVADVDVEPYIAHLKRRITRHWHGPRFDESYVIKVRFKIGPEGNVSDLRLVKSSANKKNDEAALDAVREASPVIPMPEGCPSDQVEFTFVYRTGSPKTESRFLRGLPHLEKPNR